MKGSYFRLGPFSDFSAIPANTDIHAVIPSFATLQIPSP
jgi:hypothetical protein